MEHKVECGETYEKVEILLKGVCRRGRSHENSKGKRRCKYLTYGCVTPFSKPLMAFHTW